MKKCKTNVNVLMAPLAVLLSFGLLGFVGCTPTTGSDSELTDTKEMISSLKSLATPKTLSESPSSEDLTNSDTAEANSEDLTSSEQTSYSEPANSTDSTGFPITTITITKDVKMTGTYDESYLLNPSTDVIYPGSVLTGDSVDTGSFTPVTMGTKNEVTISYNGLSGVTGADGAAGKVSGTIVPTASNYQELHNSIMTQNIKGASGTTTFSATKITSESQLKVALEAEGKYSNPAVSVSAKASFSDDTGTKTYYYLVKFAQTFYTVNLNIGDTGFLYKSMSPEYFNGYRPVYVSSIAYGRLAYLTVETTEEWNSIQADLSAAVDTSSGGASASASVTTMNKLSNSKIGITVSGFNSAPTTAAAFFEAIKNEGFSSTNTGTIVAYKLRFVDTNDIANIVFNGEYKLVSTTQSLGTITFNFNKALIDLPWGDEAASAGDRKDELEIYGKISVAGNTLWSVNSDKKVKYKTQSNDNALDVTPVTITKNSTTDNIDVSITICDYDFYSSDDVLASNLTKTKNVNSYINDVSPYVIDYATQDGITGKLYLHYTYSFNYKTFDTTKGTWN